MVIEELARGCLVVEEELANWEEDRTCYFEEEMSYCRVGWCYMLP